ncbi:DMT family transporter [Actinocatenispora comari]|uniref:Membrane protein n=1 Tax=Actinocatenispora comari TaxID=2807577 RepID=A0A8J4A8T3_9ACTN|nr:DMT family transporter [Actinocatenispora comari]GIL26323.1 membrane protein [Actinocatenispora comari]
MTARTSTRRAAGTQAPHLLAAGAMALIGTSVVASSLLSHYPYAGGQALRYGVAAVILLPLAAWRGPRVAVTAGDLVRLALLAATGMVGFNLAILAALRTAEPAVPGVFIAASPIVFALVAAVRGGSAGARRRPVVAAALVVAGAAVVQGFGDSDLAGLGWSVLALVGEVAFSAQAAPLLPRLGAIRVAGYGCALAAVEALAVGVAMDGAGVVRVPTGVEAAGLLWLALPVTVLAFLAWYTALGRLGAARATLYSGITPLVAAALAPLLGTGRLGPGQLAGAVLVAIGLLVGLAGPGALDRVRVRRPVMLPAARCDTASVGERARWR